MTSLKIWDILSINRTSTKSVGDFNALKQLSSANYLLISIYQMLLESQVIFLIVK